MRIIKCCILLIFLNLHAMAQEKVMLYSHYSFNGLAVNPAFTGTKGMLSASLSHRSQWIGFEGAPAYNVFSIHAPVRDTRTAIGLLVLNESAGLRKQTGIYLNYAHHISFGRSTLSLGLKGGVSAGSFDQVEMGYDDYLYNENALKFLMPNFGLGAYFYSKNFNAGLSVTLILGYKTGNGGDITPYHDFEKYAYYFTAGYKVSLAADWKIYPSVFMEYEKATAIVADYSLRILYKDLVSIGASYRNKGAVVLLMNYSINHQLKLGMAYDYGLSGINQYNRSSVEAVIEYNFGYRIKATNPTIF